MSGRATGWVMEYGPRGPKNRVKRAVLLAIADGANADGQHSFPGLAMICHHADYGRSAVLKAIGQLVEEGWIVIEQSGGGRGHFSSYGILGIEKGSTRRTVPKGVAEEAATEEKGAAGEWTVSEEETVRPGTERVHPEAERVHDGDSSPLIRTVLTGNGCMSPDGDQRALGVLHGFEEFWNVWPERNGKKLYRAKAEGFWKRLDLPTRRLAWRGARNYADASRQGMAGAMDAYRWLRDRSWEDWQEPARVGSNGRRPPDGLADREEGWVPRSSETPSFEVSRP